MNRKTIAIDMDNVIADTATQFINLYEKYYGVRMLAASIAGLPEHEAFPDNAVRKFIHLPDFFRTIPVMPGAQQAVKQLMQYMDVYIVSAAIEYPHSLTEKYEWLKEHFPFITWRNIIFCGDKSIVNTDYMIDDYVKNLDGCKGKTYLYTAGHNVNIDYPRRVNNWEEVVEVILKDF